MLFILIIFLAGRVKNASWSLRRFLGFPLATCAKDLLVSLVLPSSFSFFLSSWAFLRASRVSQGGISGGSLDTLV